MAKVMNFVVDSAAHKMKAKKKRKYYVCFTKYKYCTYVPKQSNTSHESFIVQTSTDVHGHDF